MKKIIYSTLSAALLLVSATAAQAEQVDFAAVGNFIRLNNGQLDPNGSQVLLGSFPSGFNFTTNTSFSQLFSAFTLYGSTFIGDPGSGPTPGQFSATAGPVLPGVVGDRLYLWIFNSPVAASATQWAILTNISAPIDNWTRPASPDGSTSLDASDLTAFVPAGAIGSIIGGPGGDIRLGFAPVPEPSTYALCITGAALVAGAVRRRRKV